MEPIVELILLLVIFLAIAVVCFIINSYLRKLTFPDAKKDTINELDNAISKLELQISNTDENENPKIYNMLNSKLEEAKKLKIEITSQSLKH